MIAWEWLDRPGLEVLLLSVAADAVTATGHVVAAFEEKTMRLRYQVSCDAAWRFRSAEIVLVHGDVSRSVQVARSAEGEWRVDGVPRADLSGCEDIDIMATPFTNTLPIRRAVAAAGLTLRAAHVRVPRLDVAAVAQAYQPLGPGRFRYRNLGSGFAAEVAADRRGLVIRYGTLWRRLGPVEEDAICA